MKQYRTTLLLLFTAIALQFLISFFPDVTAYLAYDMKRGLLGTPALITHMLAHGWWGHLFGNYTFGLPFMLYLEKRLGSRRLLEFYLLCGTAGALVQTLLAPGALIGSSGAMFGMMSGACMLFGKSKLEHALALAFFSLLFLNQLAAVPLSFMFGVAVYAHIGGALAGIMLTKKLYRPLKLRDTVGK